MNKTQTYIEENTGRTWETDHIEVHYRKAHGEGEGLWYAVRDPKPPEGKHSLRHDNLKDAEGALKRWLLFMNATTWDAGGGFLIGFPKSDIKYDVRIVRIKSSKETLRHIPSA